ncbi:MAG: hypothetical protein ACRC28_12315 [Clostridium sp.]|uniref:hypothetical protein n=1 Tax=Clostridium sp. TaxID=1506 RepID=UPI003F33186C
MVLELIKFKIESAMDIWFFWGIFIITVNRDIFYTNLDGEFTFIVFVPLIIWGFVGRKAEMHSIMPVSEKEMLKANICIGILMLGGIGAFYIMRAGLYNVTIQFYSVLIIMIGYGCIVIIGELLGNMKYLTNSLGYLFIWMVYAFKDIQLLKLFTMGTLIWIGIFFIFIYGKILKKLGNKGISME